MLDLNFYDTRSDSMEDHDFPVNFASQLEDSGSSNSSIFNAEEAAAPSCNGKDEDSFNTATGFIFDIMRRKKESEGTNWVVDENASSKLVTLPIFPVAGNGRDGDSELRLGLSTLARSPWLNLSFSNSSSGAEVKSPRQKQQLVRKSRRGPRSRSSQFRGVTYYRRTGRWESHIWDCGKQVYLGGFDTAHAAARAYDRAAIKFRGSDADINFNTSDYEEDIKQTNNLTKEEFVRVLRRHSSRFSRGSSNSQASALRKSGQWENDGGLDLSLGMSKSSEILIGNERMGFLDCHFNGGDKFSAERTKVINHSFKLAKTVSFLCGGPSPPHQ